MIVTFFMKELKETLLKHNEKDDGHKRPYVVTSYFVVRSFTRNRLANYETRQN